MTNQILIQGGSEEGIPQSDAARQAVDSLRGYAYQVTAAALAWLDLEDNGKLYLEVAEDYAVAANNALEAVQVKDTEASGTVTLNTLSIRDAIQNFITLKNLNPKLNIQLRYFTTAKIGTEKALEDRPGGMAGLEYWRKAAKGADVEPIRSILVRDTFSTAVRDFVQELDDETLRRDLLRKIHWDCGQPDLTVLHKEFEERLIVVGRDRFRLPVLEARSVADILIFRVLEKSIVKNSDERFLNKAGLYSTIEKATMISMPRTEFDNLMKMSSSLANSAFQSLGGSMNVTIAEPNWLVHGNTLPLAKQMVQRKVIETEIIAKMSNYGASLIIGSSGLGKSIVARAAASFFANDFVIVDFRNIDAEETRNRIDMTIARMGGITTSTVIFEDLNYFNDPIVSLSLACLFESLRRRDLMAIVTCYVAPTIKALSYVGLDAQCSVECPYFSEEEAGALVRLYGGDPTIWGRLAYITGAFGHPQLVHAFIDGCNSRGWPPSEIRKIVDRGLSSVDIEAEREAARRGLVSVLPQNARNLLYRLSLTISRFNRVMALAIANVPPSISQAGECLDALIGPWIETVGRESYRVSPLAARSGQEMLSPSDVVGIHNAIAAQFMTSHTINGGDADVILMHAMIGKNERVLFLIAVAILKSNEQTVELLAEHLTVFKSLRTDKSLYPDNLHISGMLRLAQFKILAVTQESKLISDCGRALFSEIKMQTKNEIHNTFQFMSFATVLSRLGIANHLENWLDIIKQFQEMVETDKFLQQLKNNMEEKGQKSLNMFGMLFAIGSANISTVANLEKIIDELDEIKSDRRNLYLSCIGEIWPNYSIFINGAWLSEHKRDSLVGTSAAECYLRMARKTARWGIEAIPIQCWIARAVMLDEYAMDKDGALKALDQAVEERGNHVLIFRARAKILFRAQNHEHALEILTKIVDDIGHDDLIERAFLMREAAICAAKTGDWAQAERWFVEGQKAAAQVKNPDMRVMAVGFGADAAVASLQIGEIERALTGLRDALLALAEIDPQSSPRAMYCHQMVRHTVLWAQAIIDKSEVLVGGTAISIEPGCCSNAEPSKAVIERPLGSLDLIWYLLAGYEVNSGCNVGITDKLYQQITGGPILVMEIEQRRRIITHDILNLNANAFAGHLWGYIEANELVTNKGTLLKTTFDVTNPTRGEIPTLPRSNYSLPPLSIIMIDAVIAYAVVAACNHLSNVLTNIEAALTAEFGPGFAGNTLLARGNTTAPPHAASSFEEALIDSIMYFKSNSHPTPNIIWLAGIRFYQQACRSNFKSALIPVIAAWQRRSWKKIIELELFRLSQPIRTVPAVKQVLSLPEDNERFISMLCVIGADAVGEIIPRDLKDGFEKVIAM